MALSLGGLIKKASLLIGIVIRNLKLVFLNDNLNDFLPSSIL